MRKTALILFACLPLISTVQAQPDLLWYQTYQDLWGIYTAEAVIEVPNGDFIIAGSYHYNVMPGDYSRGLLIRTDTEGQTIWMNYYGDQNDLWLSDIIQVEEDAFLAVGTVCDTVTMEYSIALLKINGAGDVLWNRTIDYGSNETAHTLRSISEDQFVIAGSSEIDNEDKALLVSIDADGNPQWCNTYGGSGDYLFYDIMFTNDSYLIATGLCDTLSSGNEDIYLVKTNCNGEQIWARTYGGEHYDCAVSLVESVDGGYVLVGTSYYDSWDYYDCLLMKTDADGNELWSQCYNCSGTLCGDFGRDLLLLEDGGFLLLADIGGYEFPTHHDVQLIRTDAQGTKLWQQAYEIENAFSGRSIVAVSSGGYAVTGQNYDDGIAITNSKPFLMCFEADSLGVSDMRGSAYPNSFEIYGAHPNPFNPSTVVSFRLQVACRVNLAVYDIAGRRVTQLVDGWRDAGYHEAVFDAQGLAAGVYIYYIKADSYEASGKMLLLK